MKEGEPLEVSGRDVGTGYVAVRLYPLENGEPSADPTTDNMVEADGSFTLLGRAGHGVPAGEYRVEVLQYDPYPEDKLQGEFTRENSPIEVEITGEEQTLEIDLADYQS